MRVAPFWILEMDTFIEAAVGNYERHPALGQLGGKVRVADAASLMRDLRPQPYSHPPPNAMNTATCSCATRACAAARLASAVASERWASSVSRYALRPLT